MKAIVDNMQQKKSLLCDFHIKMLKNFFLPLLCLTFPIVSIILLILCSRLVSGASPSALL